MLARRLILIAFFSFTAEAKLPSLAVPDALGVNIHFTDPKPGEMRMLADAGFKWVRMDFAWSGTERERGVYDFSTYDRLIATCKAHGISAIFILDYANRLYDDGLSPHTDAGRAAMAAWAAAAVKHFAGQPIVWEMWNEPNIAQFWKPRPSADDYAKLALAVAKAVRAADPTAVHVGPATSTIDLVFLETCFKAGLLDYWDAVSVHPYRQSDPETACDDYRRLRELIARYAPKGKTVPILSGEWGYSAGWSGFDERRQAKYLPRQVLTNLYNEVPISIWYDWHDDGQDPKEPEHHFGTVHNPYKRDATPVYDPKPAYVAMKALTAQLGGYTYNKRLTTDDDRDWILLFDKGDQQRIVAWTTSATPREVTIASSPGAVDVVDAQGKALPRVQADDGFTARLTDSAQYFSPPTPNSRLLRVATWKRAPLEMSVHAPATIIPPSEDDSMTKSGKPWHEYVAQVTDEEGAVVPSRLWMENSRQVEQRTRVVITNPIRFQILPIIDDQLCVRVANPSGEAFAGVIMPTRFKGFEIPGRQSLVIDLKKGELSQDVCFPVTHVAPRYEVTFAARNPDQGDRVGAEIKSGIAAGFAPIDIAGADALKLRPDGDAAVKSEQSLSLVDPPEPLPHARASNVLKLTYAFPAGWKFVQLMPVASELKKIEGQPKSLALWVYGDNAGHRLRLRFTDASGQTFQPNGPRIDFAGWRYLTIPLTGPDLHHWGKGDGNIHYPIQWQTLLLLDNESRLQSNGAIYVAKPTLVY